MKRYARVAPLILSFLITMSVWGQALPAAAPSDVGFSTEALDRLSAVMQQQVDEDRMAGLVVLIARRGKVAYFEPFGMRDIETKDALKKDAIFRIYSMTKPITSAAVMMLHEEGRFALDDPVAKYLPEFAGLEVGVEVPNPDGDGTVLDTVPCERDMTIRDLLRHTSGLTYGFFAKSVVDAEYVKVGVLIGDKTIADTVEKLGKIPLKHQPGTAWEYSLSTDVLGRLIEVVSGVPFDRFLHERIFTPLRMVDTGFYVPKEKQDRLATVYSLAKDGTIGPAEDGSGRGFLEPPTRFSGGGGLVSTTTDYLRFCQMILNDGELDGVRLLRPETVDLMTADHLGDIPVGFAGMAMGMAGAGFGLGFRVTRQQATIGDVSSIGTCTWGGMASTNFWIDPKQELIGIFMTQVLPTNFNCALRFRSLAYDALTP